MNESARTLVFAASLGLVSSLLLTAASRFTEPYRKANERAEEVRNVLSALQVPFPADADSKALLEIFDRNVSSKQLTSLEVYEYLPESAPSRRPEAVAVPFSGPGVWAAIKGVIALEPDYRTIRGIRFFQQEETPGLGGEIGAEWFQKQFVGKKLMTADGKPAFRILKPGGATDDNSVDGITGATMTSDRVQAIIQGVSSDLSKEREKNVQ